MNIPIRIVLSIVTYAVKNKNVQYLFTHWTVLPNCEFCIGRC